MMPKKSRLNQRILRNIMKLKTFLRFFNRAIPQSRPTISQRTSQTVLGAINGAIDQLVEANKSNQPRDAELKNNEDLATRYSRSRKGARSSQDSATALREQQDLDEAIRQSRLLAEQRGFASEGTTSEESFGENKGGLKKLVSSVQEKFSILNALLEDSNYRQRLIDARQTDNNIVNRLAN